MQHYIDDCAGRPAARRTERLLDRIVPDPALHARFVNGLARMEYVGVRKMLKSRRAERLDIEGLQHMLDEAVHALRLKKAATALAKAAGAVVTTFSDDDTLAGDAGESYLQALDREAEAALADVMPDHRAEANYLLTTAAIEVRAQVFYPVYDARLSAHGAGFSVAAISKDEDRHLAEIAGGLGRAFPNWRPRFEALLLTEETLFAGFLDSLNAAVDRVRSA